MLRLPVTFARETFGFVLALEKPPVPRARRQTRHNCPTSLLSVAGFACPNSHEAMTLKHRLTMLRPMIKVGMNGRTVQLPPKTASPHYLSPEHQSWSKKVIERAGFQCERCGRSGIRLFADHIVELKDGGNPFDLANGQAICGSCHTRKTLQERAKRL